VGSGEGINFVDFYLRQLVSGTTEEKKDAAKGLAREFTSGSPPQELLNALRTQVSLNENPETVSHAIRLLCGFKDADSLPMIVRRIASEKGNSRTAVEKAAASAISSFGGGAFPALYKLLANEEDFSSCAATLSILMKNPLPAHVAPISVLLARLHTFHRSVESGGSPHGFPGKESPDWGTIEGNSFMAAILAVEALAKIREQKSTDALFAYVGKFTGDEKPPYSEVLLAAFDVLSSLGGIGMLWKMGLLPKVKKKLTRFLTMQWADSEPLPQGRAPAAAELPANMGDIDGFFSESSLQVVRATVPPPPPGSIKRTQEFHVPPPPPPREESPPAFAPPPARDNGPSRIPPPPRAVRGPSRRTPTKNIRPPTHPVKR
jgi:hypothetical protein